MTASWLRASLGVALLALCAGCGSSEGGIVGSGISSVSGNVVIEVSSPGITGRETRFEETGHAAGEPVPAVGVTVKILGRQELETVTGDDGEFVLEGDFSGELDLEFERPGGLSAILRIDVPSGSAVVLQEVLLTNGDALPERIRQRDFLGTIRMVDCTDSGGLLRVADHSPRGNVFPVHLNTDTVLVVQSDRTALDCEDLGRGQTVRIEGHVDPVARTIRADTVFVGGGSFTPGNAEGSTIAGRVAGGGGRVAVAVVGWPETATVTTARGEFVLRSPVSGAIVLLFDTPARGRATLPLEVPAGASLFLAEITLRGGTAEPRVIRLREFTGTLAGTVLCDGRMGVLEMRDESTSGNIFPVHFTRQTLILSPGLPPRLRCAALDGTTRLTIEGTLASDGTIEASYISKPGKGRRFASGPR